MLSAVLNISLIDRLGRRPLLLVSKKLLVHVKIFNTIRICLVTFLFSIYFLNKMKGEYLLKVLVEKI